MEKTRVGFGQRLGALVLDLVFLGILTAVATAGVAAVGGVRLALRLPEAMGSPAGLTSLVDGTFGREIEARAVSLGREMERVVAGRFTPEQSEQIGKVVAREMERSFLPVEAGSGYDWQAARALLRLDEQAVESLVSRTFRAVKAAEVPGVKEADLDVVDAEVLRFSRELGLGALVPEVIGFALALLVAPCIVAVLYFLAEGIAGASLGKLLAGLRVGSSGGARADPGRTFGRFALKLAGPIVAIVALLARVPLLLAASALASLAVFGGCFAAIGPERQALHDLIAGTAVYRARELAED